MNRKKTFGVNFAGFSPVLETAKLAKLAETHGFEYVWIADENPSPLCRDIGVNMTAAAVGTYRVKIGTGICNFYTRHPALLAVFAATLDELAPGRVIVGVGPGGDIPLRPLGIRMWEKPLATVREGVTVMKRMLSGETVDFDGEMIRVKGTRLSFLPKAKIPIYLAARSPNFMRMVGEMADGSLLNTPLHYTRNALSMIREGAEKSGRRLDEIDVGNIVPFAMAESETEARERVRPLVAFMSASTPDSVHEALGNKMERIEAVRELLKKGRREKAMGLMTDEMIDEFSVAGKPNQCLERVEGFFKAGVTQMIFVIPDSGRGIRAAGTEIIPSFKT
jgi:5,10-methylenetetrahydromethanopterin reductase